MSYLHWPPFTAPVHLSASTFCWPGVESDQEVIHRSHGSNKHWKIANEGNRTNAFRVGFPDGLPITVQAFLEDGICRLFASTLKTEE